MLHAHVPLAVTKLNLQPLGRLPITNHLNLAIGLPLRNTPLLTTLLQQLYDPTSTHYHHYLTPQQFTDMFGPTEQDYQKLIAFVQSQGFTVNGTHPNRTLLDVNGSVGNIEKSFHVNMQVYRHPEETRTFYAPELEPSLDLATKVLTISGLDDYILPHPVSLGVKPFKQPVNATPNIGSAPDGYSYIGNDFRDAYAPGVSLTGFGQSVGLLEFDGYYANDITNYENQAGLPNIPLKNVLIGGFSGIPGSGSSGFPNGVLEVSLDIEMAIAMAPGLSQVIVYEAPNNSVANDLLNRMATDNVAKQLSSSWGFNINASTEAILQEFALQGQAFFMASGDSGAVRTEAMDPTDPYITLVGGTILSTAVAGGSWTSETTWPSSGGGVASNNPIPSWQQGINMTINHGSMLYRNYPDVSIVAQDIWILYNNGLSGRAYGTSASAPLWAGFTALVNQQAEANGDAGVGSLNPALYGIGTGLYYASAFHDITTGNNTNSLNPTSYFAVAGYDLCTGWGTPNGIGLIDLLAPSPDTLHIIPGTGFDGGGAVGGPFNQLTKSFLLTNASVSTFSWSVINTSVWLSVSPDGGILMSRTSTTAVVSVNPAIYTLPAGIYTANLQFSNLSTHITQTRQFTLRIGQSLVQNGGFETGDFSDWVGSGNWHPGGFGPEMVFNSTSQAHSGSFYAAVAPANTLGYISQTLPTVAGSSYMFSLWFSNTNGARTNELRVLWNGNALFDQTNIPRTTWTNLQFPVLATASSTTLKIGFRTDSTYMLLDDISVTPMFTPVFQSVTRTNTTVTLAWNSPTGLTYQVQFKSNCSQSTWSALGTTITATNNTMTVSDLNATDPQKYYRLLIFY
jgi:hypothetical protein